MMRLEDVESIFLECEIMWEAPRASGAGSFSIHDNIIISRRLF